MRLAASRYASACGIEVAGQLEQVRAHREQPVVVGDARIVVEGGEQVEPRRRPVHLATATARLSVTIGLGATWSSTS